LYTWTHTLNRTRSTASYRRKKVHVRYLSSADERLYLKINMCSLTVVLHHIELLEYLGFWKGLRGLGNRSQINKTSLLDCQYKVYTLYIDNLAI